MAFHLALLTEILAEFAVVMVLLVTILAMQRIVPLVLVWNLVHGVSEVDIALFSPGMPRATSMPLILVAKARDNVQ